MGHLRFRKDLTRSLIDFHVEQAVEDRSLRGLILNIGAGTRTYREEIGRFEDNRLILADWPGSPTSNSVGVFCDAHELPFGAAVFDAVLCTEVLEHLKDPRRAVREIYRVLKNESLVLLTTPFQYQAHQRPFDYFRFTYDGLRLLTAEAGFHDVSIYRRGESLAVALNSLKVFTGRVRAGLLHRVIRLAERLYVRWYGTRSLKVPLGPDPMALGYTVIARKDGIPSQAEQTTPAHLSLPRDRGGENDRSTSHDPAE
jgi:SAM-dependent methyltransferase